VAEKEVGQERIRAKERRRKEEGLEGQKGEK
jgi:hypothetical protein